jgi:hypothetical protein
MIIIGLTVKTGIKTELPLQLRKASLTLAINLPLLLSVEATQICIPVGNTEMLLAAVYTCKSVKIVE